MNRTADLDIALAFVTQQIEREAMLSGAPLNDEQKLLLKHLPTWSALPLQPITDLEDPPEFVPRDLPYEELCAVAKAAYLRDVSLNPASAAEWEFAAAVAKLNRHPMTWLLSWAGVEVRKPHRDRLRLVAAALVCVAAGLAGLAAVLSDTLPLSLRILIGLGSSGVLAVVIVASLRMEPRHLRRTIEQLRPARF